MKHPFHPWRALVALIAILVLSHCALLEEEDTPATAPTAAAPVPSPTPGEHVASPTAPAEKPPEKVDKAEFGSLWTESSVWNRAYSLPQRSAGDTIQIRIEEHLRTRILSRFNFVAEPLKSAGITPPPKPIDTGLENKPPVRDLAKPEAPQMLKARIRELKPKGGYAIVASEKLTYGKQEPRIFLEGRISEADIDSFDVVSSDSIQDLKLEVYAPQPENSAPDAPKVAATPDKGGKSS